MYSFNFGPPVPLQELNLRTYTPRPQPSDAEWQFLRAAWSAHAKDPQPADYGELVRRLRSAADQAAVKRELADQLAQASIFALPLAVRLIDTADDPACAAAVKAAVACLAQLPNAAALQGADREGSPQRSPQEPPLHATFADLMSAAALVADFGSPEEQQSLLALLRTGIEEREPAPEFRAWRPALPTGIPAIAYLFWPCFSTTSALCLTSEALASAIATWRSYTSRPLSTSG